MDKMSGVSPLDWGVPFWPKAKTKR